jgi:PAS domain S-box-containing protein
MDPDVLTQENERLRHLNSRLRSALDEVQARLSEPEEIIRAIRQGEIDALVVQEEGQEEIYSLQHYDSVYRSMVEQCFPFGVWLAEPDGRLLYVSPSFLDLVRTDLAAMRKGGQFHFLPAETREAVEREWARCRETGDPLDVEYTVRFGDGSERAIWTRGVLATAQGQHHWVGVNIDVTERKVIKEELHRQAETLRRQADALRDADRRKDEFLALLGHELRNPLATISNGLHVLLRPDVDPENRGQVREMMAKQVHHLTRLVDDLLDVNRITRGRIQLRKQRLDLSDAVHHAVESVHPLVEDQGHELTVSLAPGPLLVEADPTRLEQILVNLLNNAAKYTRPGGRITLTADQQGGEAVIRVRDTGVGIPAELLPRVFDLFIQVERSLDRSQGGLGIGLTLVKELVEMHGGSVTAHSEGPDKGSEFVVRLPVLPRSSEKPELPRRGAPSADGRRLRVLVVDDSRDLAQSIKILLELSGHDVRMAHDGPAALEAYRSYKPDVVLLDVGLPGMSGYEVASRLRTERETDATMVVAVSGYGQEEDKLRALEAGFDLHMTKPVDPIRLGALLASRSSPSTGRADPADLAGGGPEA